jgi:hypothetical protein
MKEKLFKRKNFILLIGLFCILGSIVLIILNFSIIQNTQIQYRNQRRQADITEIADGIKKYITNSNNCPRINTPVPETFLPDLVFEGSNNPKGGVNISTLEDMETYIDLGKKEPNGGPYLIGTFENKIYIYTNNFETLDSPTKAYFQIIETSLCSN